ncbi:hypothetical protein [Mycobacterium sp. NPDC050853]|uniref:hypothetical protein n=1 Tax=Mycobacterium sp. NPDC050853 TaxID=3155160 RepID=UPI0033ED3A6C
MPIAIDRVIPVKAGLCDATDLDPNEPHKRLDLRVLEERSVDGRPRALDDDVGGAHGRQL